jgi:hypothetical protein
MQFLCHITDWDKRTVERGRAAGNEITTRTVIAADNWNWLIGLETQGKPQIIGQKFYGGFSTLLPALYQEKVDVNIVSKRVIAELSLRTGIAFDADKVTVTMPAKSPVTTRCGSGKAIDPVENSWAILGRKIDVHFDVIFNGPVHPPTIIKRIFKAVESD